MAYPENTTNQPSLEFSPFWLSIIKDEIKRIQENGSLNWTYDKSPASVLFTASFCSNEFPLPPLSLIVSDYFNIVIS
jgi:hypothetical protein